MPDPHLLTDQMARTQIAERISRAERSRLPGSRRPRGRQALAQRLHRLADRLDV